MGVYSIKLPDVGEGVAEAELVEWAVNVGDVVREDDVLGAVMTDKATVEIPSPVTGKIEWLGPDVGDVVAVGSVIIRLDVEGDGNTDSDAPPPATEAPVAKPVHEPEVAKAAEAVAPKQAPKSAAVAPIPSATATAPRPEGQAPIASPAVRKRAMDAGIDLRQVAGSGPAGRITHEDLDAVFGRGNKPGLTGVRPSIAQPDTSITEVKVIGLRRKIAEQMSRAKSRIPHITYVDEVDVTALETLRQTMNASRKDGQEKLTILPFLMRAMSRAIAEQPQMNAIFDDEKGVVNQYGAQHMGVAVQTDNGLIVPVVRHVEALGLRQCASELTRLSEAARTGTAGRDELSGSTITITSLGAMGGIVTTPVINHPEVAIIGVNKMQTLPKWDGTQFVPRKVMNLSSSFDHRVIDGWDAAVFIQKIKTLLENPAMIFVED